MLALNKILLLAILWLGAFCQNCHYSCATCIDQLYNYCLTCSEGNTFQIVQDPSQVRDEHKNSDLPTGVCIGHVDTSLNILGILLLVVCVLGLIISRGSRVFYFIYTMQNLALLSFLQIAWLSPLSYLLGALQYFLVFNVISTPLKQTTWDIKEQSFYRLDRFYHESSLVKSMIILGIVNCFILVLLIVLPLIQKLKKKQCSDSCRCFLCANWFLDLIQRGCQIIFFLMIEETILSIVVAFNFTQSLDWPTILITCLYGIAVIVFIIFSTKFKIKLFPNKFIQFQNFVKKIIYPVFLIIRPPQQYVLIIFMLSNIVLELLFDGLCNVYPLKSRMAVYKAI